jgi:hypothetical protein
MDMIKKLCLVVCLVLSMLFFVCVDSVSSSKASDVSENIVLNESVDPEMKGDYIIIEPGPVNGKSEEEKEKDTKIAVVLIVCLLAVFGGTFLLFAASIAIAFAYMKYSKSVETVDKLKNSFVGKLALKGAKAMGNPALATAATVIEAAPTDLYKMRQQEDSEDEFEEDFE